jgi:hypothetical protein
MTAVQMEFWIWYGKEAAMGNVVAGDQDQCRALESAFEAGWCSSKVDTERATGRG